MLLIIDYLLLASNQSTSTNHVSSWPVSLVYTGYFNSVSIVHAETKIKTTAETLQANFIRSQRNSLCSPEPLPSEYTDLADTVWLSMVSMEGGGLVGWRWSTIIPRESPSWQSSIVYPESSILFRAWQATFSYSRSDLPGRMCVCVFWAL